MKRFPRTTLVVDLRVEVEVIEELGKTMRPDILRRSFEEALTLRNIKPGLDVKSVEVLQYFNM
jgi:hypothetical protein